MGSEPPLPSTEEVERTYRMVAGMASTKRFKSEVDREDFIQDVLLSAYRSYDGQMEHGLSFKNLACGPAFSRAYQSYWRGHYNRSFMASNEICHGRHEGENVRQTASPPERFDSGEPVPDTESAPYDQALTYLSAGGTVVGTASTRNCSIEVEELADPGAAEFTDILLKDLLVAEINGLKPPLGDLIFFFLQGMTRDEVARAMGKSTSWAKKYTLKALSLLINRLKKRGLTLETVELDEIVK